MANTIKYRLRGDTAENWENKNTILAKNEPGYDQTANRLKFGDDTTAWKDLPYLKPDVIDNLNSDSTTDALSAAQGRVLKTLIDGKADKDELNTLQDTLTHKIEESISGIDIDNETWTFTLEDDTTIEKTIALWTGKNEQTSKAHITRNQTIGITVGNTVTYMITGRNCWEDSIKGITAVLWSWYGQIPPGLALSTDDGVISGTPTNAGTYMPTVVVNTMTNTDFGYDFSYDETRVTIKISE